MTICFVADFYLNKSSSRNNGFYHSNVLSLYEIDGDSSFLLNLDTCLPYCRRHIPEDSNLFTSLLLNSLNC
jgi:hypothetical protein